MDSVPVSIGPYSSTVGIGERPVDPPPIGLEASGWTVTRTVSCRGAIAVRDLSSGNPVFKPTTGDALDMPTTIEYCISNGSPNLRSALDHDSVEFRERRCLEHCGICRARKFAVVDGRPVVDPELASTIGTLIEDTATEKSQ